MFKTLFALIRIFFILLVLGLIFHNLTARLALEKYLEYQLGAPVHIESARVDFLGTQVFYRNVMIQNPAEFPEGPAIKISYLLLDFDAGAFFDGHWHFDKIEADVSDFQILRNQENRVNWLNFKTVQELEKGNLSLRPAACREVAAHFVLNLRRATYRDDSKPNVPAQMIPIDLEAKDYGSLCTFQEMVMILSKEALSRMGFSNLGAGILQTTKSSSK